MAIRKRAARGVNEEEQRLKNRAVENDSVHVLPAPQREIIYVKILLYYIAVADQADLSGKTKECLHSMLKDDSKSGCEDPCVINKISSI